MSSKTVTWTDRLFTLEENNSPSFFLFLGVLRRESGTVTPATRTGNSRSTRPSACPVAICQKKKKKEGKGTAQRKSSENMPQRDLLRWIERIEVKTIRPAASESGATFLFIHLPGTALLSPTSTPTRSHEKKSTKGQQEIALLELPRSQCSYRGRWKTPNEGFQRLPFKKKKSFYFSPHKTKKKHFF